MVSGRGREREREREVQRGNQPEFSNRAAEFCRQGAFLTRFKLFYYLIMTERRNIIAKFPSLCVVLAVLLSWAPQATAAWGQSGWQLTPSAAARFRSSSSSSETTSTTVLPMTAMRPRREEVPETQRRKSADFQPDHILEDGHGRVNADLAATLWNWEQQHRETAKLPKLSFSTRQGLRLVDDIVKSMEESPRGQKLLKTKDDTIRTDLVQEGVIALMDALNEYRQPAFQDEQGETTGSLEDHNLQFEAYARPYLEDRLWSTLDKTTRPMQLPETESNLWKHIQKIRPQLQSELGGRSPTTKELAARLQLPTETLELLMASKRGTLSMESTVEIKNPDSLEDQTAHFTDQEEWEQREGHLLDTGEKIIKDELVDEYQGEMYQYEGEDEMWLHHTQVAGPLRDIIPDEGPSIDDLALSDMIRHDVGEFLTNTLTPDEVQVVRMSFGLDAGDPLQWNEIAQTMGVEVSQAKELLSDALEKLRATYRNNYVESFLEEEQDFFGEDSV